MATNPEVRPFVARSTRCLAVLLYVFVVHACAVGASLATADAFASVKDRLVTDIEATVSCRHISGASIAIVTQSGTTLMSRGFGRARIDSSLLSPHVDGLSSTSSSAPDGLLGDVPCTEKTKFAIASLSKAFTAALIGVLLKENEHRFPNRWDTRVVDVMGLNFRFADVMRTEQTTLRDLLAHRTGLPGYKMALMAGLDPELRLVWQVWSDHRTEVHHSGVLNGGADGHRCAEKITFSNPQINGGYATREDKWNCCKSVYRSMGVMRLVETSTTLFRNHFDYSNLMYLVAGCVAETMAGGGQSLESLMRDKLFGPLGMVDTHIISELSDEDERFATMYMLNETTNSFQELNKYIVRTVMPLDAAGGVITTAEDMAEWMYFQLNRGRTRSGRQLIPAQYWNQMHSPQMALSKMMDPVHKPWFPVEDTYTTYGFGWRLGSYREHLKSEHNGRLAGFESKITLMHATGVGVFSVSNGPVYHGKDFHTVLHYLVLDAILGLIDNSGSSPTSWLNETTRCTFPEPWLGAIPSNAPHNSPAVGSGDATAAPPVPPLGWLDDAHLLYVGNYHHTLLGFYNVTYSSSSHMDNAVPRNPVARDPGLQLRFRSGSIGEGYLDYVDGFMWMMTFDGPLAYFGKTGPYRHYPLPIIFRRSAGDDDGQFSSVEVLPYEPQAPPVYKRIETER